MWLTFNNEMYDSATRIITATVPLKEYNRLRYNRLRPTNEITMESHHTGHCRVFKKSDKDKNMLLSSYFYNEDMDVYLCVTVI